MLGILIRDIAHVLCINTLISQKATTSIQFCREGTVHIVAFIDIIICLAIYRRSNCKIRVKTLSNYNLREFEYHLLFEDKDNRHLLLYNNIQADDGITIINKPVSKTSWLDTGSSVSDPNKMALRSPTHLPSVVTIDELFFEWNIAKLLKSYFVSRDVIFFNY